MRFLAGEIYQDLVEEQVPLGHAAEAPAFVETKRAGPQLFQLIRLTRSQLSGFDEFLQFGIHDGTTNYEEGFDSRVEIRAKPILLMLMIVLLIPFQGDLCSRDYDHDQIMSRSRN